MDSADKHRTVKKHARALVRYRTWADRFFQGGASGCGCSIFLVLFLVCGGAFGHADRKATGDEIQSLSSTTLSIAAVGVFFLLAGLGFSAVADLIYSMRKRKVLAEAQHEVAALLVQHASDRLIRPLWAVMKVLGDLGDKTAAAALVNVLQDSAKRTRRAVAEALDKLDSAPERDHEGRADYLLAKEEWEKLDELGERALAALIRGLGDKDTTICKKTAETLGKIGSENAVPALNQAAVHSNKGVQKAARAAVQKIAAARKQ